MDSLTDEQLTDEYLTQEEIKSITKYSQPARQHQWLNDNGWLHTVASDKTVNVLRKERDRKMLGKVALRRKTKTKPRLDLLAKSLSGEQRHGKT